MKKGSKIALATVGAAAIGGVAYLIGKWVKEYKEFNSYEVEDLDEPVCDRSTIFDADDEGVDDDIADDEVWDDDTDTSICDDEDFEDTGITDVDDDDIWGNDTDTSICDEEDFQDAFNMLLKGRLDAFQATSFILVVS